MNNKVFRVYRSELADSHLLAKIRAYLADRPGSLAELASVFKSFSINIVFFYYDRSEQANRVLLEVTGNNLSSLHQVYQELSDRGLFDSDSALATSELGVVDAGSILKIEVQLKNRPGTLGDFAKLLERHDANVIYMEFNEDISETSAKIALFTRDPEEIDILLKDMNTHAYYYSIVYKGAGHKEIEDVIGLNLTERFFFKLKQLLKTDDIDRLNKVINSSHKMRDTLMKFNSEAGKHFEEGDIITNVLAFASKSLMKTEDNFSYRRLPSISFDDVTFHAFRMPTGGNIYILQSVDELVMIDTSYGLYYDNVKKMLKENDLDPALVGRIYLTHADADHAGLSGYFSTEFGSQVYMHKDARGIIEHENRAWGSGSPLLELNYLFTVLVNEFTKFSVPENWTPYPDKDGGTEGPFKLIGEFRIAGQTYKILESLGGHVPGQVFIFSYDSGLIFTGDYLLMLESITPEEKNILNYPKFMMTSTNVKSTLFRTEMNMLKEFIGNFQSKLIKARKEAIVVPGHGDYYSFKS